jgi:hypothetical protein
MMLSYTRGILIVVLIASCGCQDWGPGRCYWCTKKRSGLLFTPWAEGIGLSARERLLVGLNGNGHKESRGRWVEATSWLSARSSYEVEDRDEEAMRGIQYLISGGDVRGELRV